jgi:hypothetical protein
LLPLNDPGWNALAHAYGSASDIPMLLARAATDPRPGHHPESSWFDLWSALCHQGDVYSASYAAVPHLIAMVPGALAARSYEPLLLAASIEQARLEGTGPEMPSELRPAYQAAVVRGRELAAATVDKAWSSDARTALTGSLAALSGDLDGARAIFEADLESEG